MTKSMTNQEYQIRRIGCDYMDELHMTVKKFPQIIRVIDVTKKVTSSMIVHKVKQTKVITSKDQQEFQEVFFNLQR